MIKSQLFHRASGSWSRQTCRHFLSMNEYIQGRPFCGLPWWLSGKESTCQYRRHGFNPWVGKILWRRKWPPTLCVSRAHYRDEFFTTLSVFLNGDKNVYWYLLKWLSWFLESFIIIMKMLNQKIWHWPAVYSCWCPCCFLIFMLLLSKAFSVYNIRSDHNGD